MAPGSPIAQGTLQTRSPSRGASCLGQGCGLCLRLPSSSVTAALSVVVSLPPAWLVPVCQSSVQEDKTLTLRFLSSFLRSPAPSDTGLSPSLCGFHISEKLLGCISTCNSLLKRNKNDPRLKQIVTGGEKGRLYNGLCL